MGDDTTDDDMFEALPHDSFAVKVGSVSEKALYNMPQQERVLPFLRSLTEKVPGRFGAVPQKARTDGDPLRKKAVANEKPINLVSP